MQVNEQYIRNQLKRINKEVEQQLNGKLPELINVPQKPHPS